MGFFDSFFGIDDEYLLRGRAKLEIGDYKGAKKDFKKSKEMRDTDYEDIYEEYFYRGIAKFYLNDFKGALKDFYRSKLLDKDEFILEEIEEWIQKTKLKDV